MHPSARTYTFTWLGLMVLTGVSWGASYIPLHSWELVVALGIAVTKATLVGLVFMHLAGSPFTLRLSLLVSLSMLAIMLGFMSLDVAFRRDSGHPGALGEQTTTIHTAPGVE